MKLTKHVLSATLALTALVSATPAHAVLKEARSTAEILPYVDAQTLVLFDLDNTVIEPVQTLGSDQWAEHLYLKLVDQGVALEEAKARMVEAFKRVNAVSAVKPVEAATPRLIHGLQENGVAVMGLTARPSDFSRRTLEQLASVGVDFSKTAPAGSLEGGVTFADGQDKGVTLLALLKRIGFKPKRIVFVDDKLHNTQDVERALDGTSIEHFSFRYGAADEEVKSFDPTVANVQARYFGRILDDEAARKLGY